MSYTEIENIKSENVARVVAQGDFLFHSTERNKHIRQIDTDSLDDKEIDLKQRAETATPKPKSEPERVVIQIPAAILRHLQPAQETEEERAYRYQQIEYERNGWYKENQVLAQSINTLAEQNFSNRLLAVACDFNEMAENHPRSVFIQKFGPMIEEELKADPTKPSRRLASFATTYFWKEANTHRMVAAVPPSATRAELLEFFTLVPNSEPNKTIADFLSDNEIGEIVYATTAPENKKIKFDFRKKFPYVSLDESGKLEESIQELAQQNFTNRLLASTFYFCNVMNPFNAIRSIKEFGPAIKQELEANPDKPSQTLVSTVTEFSLEGRDIQAFFNGVTEKTTKAELSEFFTTREKWSTGLRMIDYLNHHAVMEMARFLPDQDKLDLWMLRPELVNGFHVDRTLKKLSPDLQQQILDTIKDPVRKEAVRENIKNELVGLRIGTGFKNSWSANPSLLDIPAQFSVIRERRICSHDDNRRFFHANEHFRSSY